jgi:hypothetical protein
VATYYVRKSGNDASAGTSAGTAWLTIGKALGAAGIASGDTVYIGAGTYRETVTVAMTSAVAETFVIGDVDGAKTGDAGEVVWTAYTTNDTTTPAAAATLNLSGRDHLTFQQLTLIGGNANPSLVSATTATSTDIKFEDCAFLMDASGNLWGMQINGAADTASNWTFNRCALLSAATGGGIYINLLTSTTADYDVVVAFNDCLLMSHLIAAIRVDVTGAGAFKPGGVRLQCCTGIGPKFLDNPTGSLSTSIPASIYNSVLVGGVTVQTSGSLLEDNNLIIASTPRTNVTAGAASKVGPTLAPLFEIGQALLHGRLGRRFFEPTAGSPVLGFGTHAGAPAVDFLNRPKPAGGASTAGGIGYLERHDTGAREASVVDASTYSLKLTGPADHDLLIPVNAASTSITLRARYDTNHAATNKPQAILQANGEIGVATETKTMTAAVDTWETLTFSTFTPSARGFVTVRLISRSAAGNGIAYFDTLTGPAIGTGTEDYWNRGEAFPAATSTSTGGSPWHFP